MVANFLPTEVGLLTDPASVALAQQIERRTIGVIQHPPKTTLSWQIATACVCRGTGTPIVLLHGFDSSLLEFRRILPLLAEHHQVWAIDLLGFGFTERVKGVPINPSSIKRHLYSFWQTAIAQPIILIGASMGGAVAIDFTLTHPQCVSKLVLIDSIGFSGSFPLGRLLVAPLDWFAVEWLRYRKLAALNAVSALPNADPVLIDTIRCSLLHQQMPGWNEAIASFTQSGGYSDLTPKIAQIHHPTLILWGESDDVLGTGDGERFRRAIAHSNLVWIQNSGHVPHLEQPKATVREILAFL
ncbi:alpha/beta hydrolase [Oculatella sp. FACHB-28]|uniref:alpha/beta fold hydrolase n=1 Tax=Oculatella sp. FACHB-28 TaxID=2692845 RepID=UPI00168245B7|nr:alpha/beta hydrolase [Oculatella sp. FACHB-28]MBD2055533.1 alpha/beta hydrolase [Oculatella sp. FACHB-28]